MPLNLTLKQLRYAETAGPARALNVDAAGDHRDRAGIDRALMDRGIDATRQA